MSLLDEDDTQPTLQVSPGALLSDQPRLKESKREKRKGGGLTLGRTKPREPGAEKVPKKGKHVRNKSGSRTPPDSPRAERGVRGGKNQPSPHVKAQRKRYSQLGLNLSSAESEGEEEEQTYFANQAATEGGTTRSSSQEPFFSIEATAAPGQPTSPGLRTTVHFPVQFGEAGSAVFPSAAFEPQPPLPSLPQSTVDGAPQSPTNPLLPCSLPHPSLPPHHPGPWNPPSSPPSDPANSLPEVAAADLSPAADPGDGRTELDQKVPESEWHVSKELRLKCRRQFVELQPTHGRLQGDLARTFFVQSRLPNADLSAIWRLADMDHDNALSEQEFLVAMKLVLLRRKGYRLPTSLPLSLRETAAEDSHKAKRNVPPVLASQSVAELPLAQPHAHPSLFEISQHSQPELSIAHQPFALLVDISEPSDATANQPVQGTASHSSSLVAADTSTVAERGELAVATIVSLAEERKEEQGEDDTSPLFHSFTEKPTRPPPAHPSVRRARSLKHFTPPPESDHNSPPPSPFSPPATGETAPIISVDKPTPKARVHKSIHSSKDKSGYHTLSAAGGAEEGHEAEQLAIGRDRGHARSTSLDLNKMIASSNVYSDMPAAEPPRPPPKPVAEDGDVSPQVRGRSASTGSISSTGPPLPPPSLDASTSTLLLPGMSRPVPARKAPLHPPVPKPRRPPPPRPEPPDTEDNSFLRSKSELQTTIRALKDTNATLQALNRELEDKLFGLMEDRVQLAREVELSRQMQTSA